MGVSAAGDIDAVAPISMDRYRSVSYQDLESMMSAVGVRDPLANYNVLVDGMGTGLAPPTADEWDLFLSTAMLDGGAQEYQVPTASSLDLSAEVYFPQVRSQGGEGSCAAWALTYYNYGYIEARDQGWTQAKSGNNTQLLSPSWTYNKVNGVTHEGSSYSENARMIQQLGVATWDTFPYVDTDDQGFGGETAWRSAPAHRISSYVSVWNPDPDTVVALIKEQLGLYRPISFAMDANEYTPAFADGNKIMSAAEYEHSYYNHGQTIVGYDDVMTDDGEVGAFKVVNSWGSSFGQGGYYWITYQAIKEMLGFPMVYLLDRTDYQPSLLATWEFTTGPSVDTDIDVGAGSSTSPSDKVSTYFSTGNVNRFPGFMALDVSTLYNEYLDGEEHYFLNLKNAALSGTVSSFHIELYGSGYVPGEPSQMMAISSEVPKSVPGVVNATLVNEDLTPPSSEVQDLPAYVNASTLQLTCTSSDSGSGVDHLELFYRFNSGSYTKYLPASNPSGEWTGESITFDIAQAAGQGPYQFCSIAVDGVGNRESAPSVPDASTTVDLTAPNTSIGVEGTMGDNGWYVSSVTVTLNASDLWSGVDHITYRWNEGEWTDYSSTLTLQQGNHTLECYAVDRAGNQETVRDIIVHVDDGKPTVNVEINATATNGWYRSSVTVTMQADDDMDLDCSLQYRLDEGSWTTYLNSFVVAANGEHLLEYYATDRAGNVGGEGSLDIDIDALDPVCGHSLQGQIGDEGRYVTAVNVTLSPSDQGSGVDAAFYRLDDGVWQEYSSTFQMIEDGAHVLEYYAVDVAGNTGPVVQVDVVIDSLGPSASMETDRSSSNGWFDGAVTVTLIGQDLFDDGCPVHYRLDDGSWLEYTQPLLLEGEGWYVLEYYAVDLAGNQGATETNGIGIDMTDPNCTSALVGTVGLNDYFISQVTVTIYSSDDGSGVDAAYYRLNGGVWKEYEGAFTMTVEGSITLDHYAVDRAGNDGEALSRTVKIDTKAPTISAETDVEATLGWFNSSVEVTLVPITSDAGCSIHYRLNGGAWTSYAEGITVEQEGRNLLEWYGTDTAGNQGQPVSRELFLDMTAPECSLGIAGETGPNGYYVSSVELTLNSFDQGSGVWRTLYRLDGGEWMEYLLSVQVLEDGEHFIEYYALDRAGNADEVQGSEIDIDTTPPQVQIAVVDEIREDGTYLNDATVRFLAEDEVSGVAACSYSLDGSPWQQVEGDLLVEGEGVHVIKCDAVDLVGNNVSSSMSFEISMPEEAPEEVQGLTASIVEDGIYLNWSPSVTDLEARYLIFRSNEGEEVLVANVTGTSYLDVNVVEGEAYDYRVVPMNLIGEGPSSNVLGMVIPGGEDLTPYFSLAIAALVAVGLIVLILKRKK